MSRWYTDTSAALKLIVAEDESETLARRLEAEQPDAVAGWLLETELRRAVGRDTALTQTMVTQLLRGISLYEMPQSTFRDAGLLAGSDLRSLDALHLATALRLGVDAVLTYDQRMARAAQDLGLDVVSPGAGDVDR